MHQAQPKEGHKIWLTQEADAKSWSGLKHVQPKEGRKELAPREIKFRYTPPSLPVRGYTHRTPGRRGRHQRLRLCRGGEHKETAYPNFSVCGAWPRPGRLVCC